MSVQAGTPVELELLMLAGDELHELQWGWSWNAQQWQMQPLNLPCMPGGAWRAPRWLLEGYDAPGPLPQHSWKHAHMELSDLLNPGLGGMAAEAKWRRLATGHNVAWASLRAARCPELELWQLVVASEILSQCAEQLLTDSIWEGPCALNLLAANEILDWRPGKNAQAERQLLIGTRALSGHLESAHARRHEKSSWAGAGNNHGNWRQQRLRQSPDLSGSLHLHELESGWLWQGHWTEGVQLRAEEPDKQSHTWLAPRSELRWTLTGRAARAQALHSCSGDDWPQTPLATRQAGGPRHWGEIAQHLRTLFTVE